MRLAMVSTMAPNRGNRNPPRITMTHFLPERDTCLSVTLPSASLYFCSLRVLQTHNFLLPFRMMNIHSRIKFTSSLLEFVIKALRNLCSAVLST